MIKKGRYWSLSRFFIFIVFSSVLAVFFAVSVFNYFKLKSITESNTLKGVMIKAEKNAGEFYGRLMAISQPLGYASRLLESSVPGEAGIILALKNIIFSDDMVIGSGLFFTPYSYRAEMRNYGPYVLKSGSGFRFITDYQAQGETDYDYTNDQWFINSIKNQTRILWTEPYFDKIVKMPMITVSSALNRGGTVFAVMTADIGLNQLSEMVKKMMPGRDSYAFVVTAAGHYMAHPLKGVDFEKRISDEKEPGYSALYERIKLNRRTESLGAVIDGKRRYLIISPIGNTGMTLVGSIPEEEISSAVNSLLVIDVSVFIISVAFLFFLLRGVIRKYVIIPLDNLTLASSRFTGENKDIAVSVEQNNESGVLASTFNGMAERISNLLDIIKEDNRLLEQRVEDRTKQLNEALTELEKISVTDKLTGLFNRRRVDELFPKYIEQSRRFPQPLSLIMIDADHFKKVNDDYGHQMGDEVLRFIGETIASVKRSIDIGVRWGGEEFMIILPSTDIHGAAVLAEKISSSMRGHAFQFDRTVTVSIGVSELREDDDINSFIKRVDDLLYRAKGKGRDRIELG